MADRTSTRTRSMVHIAVEVALRKAERYGRIARGTSGGLFGGMFGGWRSGMPDGPMQTNQPLAQGVIDAIADDVTKEIVRQLELAEAAEAKAAEEANQPKPKKRPRPSWLKVVGGDEEADSAPAAESVAVVCTCFLSDRTVQFVEGCPIHSAVEPTAELKPARRRFPHMHEFGIDDRCTRCQGTREEIEAERRAELKDASPRVRTCSNCRSLLPANATESMCEDAVACEARRFGSKGIMAGTPRTLLSGPLLVPDVPDAQGDVISAEEIEKASRAFPGVSDVLASADAESTDFDNLPATTKAEIVDDQRRCDTEDCDNIATHGWCCACHYVQPPKSGPEVG